MSRPSVVFAGTPNFSATCLKALLGNKNIKVTGVFTQPDRPRGRGKKLQASPVKAYALEQGLPVFQPNSLKSAESRQALIDLKPDLLIVVAYGLLLPQEVLDIPTFGCVNVHASLLPRWRGAAPIERAIAAGDLETGITIMQMDAGLDTGPMLAKANSTIKENDTGDSLRERLAHLGASTLNNTLPSIFLKQLQIEQQDNSLATYATKLTKEEAQINWHLPAKQINQQIRAFNSSNVCWCLLSGERLKIWESHVSNDLNITTDNPEIGSIIHADSQGVTIACGEGSLTITLLQLPGKRPMSAHDMLNSKKSLFATGTVLF